MGSRRNKGATANVVFLALACATALLFVASIDVIFLRTPIEKQMGIVQKIFYFHVPAACALYLGGAACFGGSVAYLLRPTEVRDAIARSGAELAVVFGATALTMGPLWGAKAWGHFWAWDPELTTSLLSELIYIAYLVLRKFSGDGEGERKFAAALGIVGGANLPIVHYAAQKWGGMHPTVIKGSGGGLDPSMRLALALGFITFALFACVLLWARVRVEITASRIARAEEDAIDLGLDDRQDGEDEPLERTEA